MSLIISSINPANRILIVAGIILLLLFAHPAFAATGGIGGGLPFDSYLEKLKLSITGPFAFTAAIAGLAGAGAVMIFGSADLNGFFRTLIFIVLVLSFLVTAENMMQAVTGRGAEIAASEAYFKLGRA